MGDHPPAAHRCARRVLRMVHRFRVHRSPGTGSICVRPTARCRRPACCAACISRSCRRARPSTSRAARRGVRRGRRHPGRLTDIRAVGLGGARRPRPPVRLHLRGAGARFPCAGRRFDGDVPVLGGVRPGTRAHHQRARSGDWTSTGPRSTASRSCPTGTARRRRSTQAEAGGPAADMGRRRRSSTSCAARLLPPSCVRSVHDDRCWRT